MTIEDLKNKGLIIFECISGSKAYGLDLPESDTDIKGVFILPEDNILGFNYIAQINNETNDIVYYELKRFIELLEKNNPNIMEMLYMPDECILFKHNIMDFINLDIILSKLCKNTFAGYALTQVKKARGLNKKIVNPMTKTKKSILDFCYIVEGQGSVKLKNWLKEKNYKQEYCGIVNIPHMENIYGIFYDDEADKTQGKKSLGFKGILKNNLSTKICLSSIPEGMKPLAMVFYNENGYKKYCKDYKEYWQWVEMRNENRYQNTLSHGKNYDGKNMMHTMRLLDMAEEIARDKKLLVRRPNREYLLKIRKGDFEYDELVSIAENRIQLIEELFDKSDLVDKPDINALNELLIKMRKAFYNKI